MSYEQKFWVRKGEPFNEPGDWKYLGTCEREPRIAARQQVEPPLSYAYFCPRCGEVWAKAEIVGQPFMVWTISCEEHDPGWTYIVAGSMMLAWEREYNDVMPEAVIRREFLVHMRHASKHPELTA